MKVKKTIIPNNSLIQIARPNSNFEECYETTFTSLNSVKIETVTRLFFTSFSDGWMMFLFRLRDWLVKPLKLKVAEDYRQVIPVAIEKGQYIGFFKIVEKNNEEILMHGKDSHLHAYIGLSFLQNQDKRTLKASTIVFFNNTLGSVYFFIIKPFHKLIIKTLLKRVAVKIKNSNKL